MFKKIGIVALAIVASAIALIAPVAFVGLAVARPPLAAAAATYDANATCSGRARTGFPPPTQPIPDSARNGVPCAISGAIVVEKDTLSRGSTGATHYALGLRSESGAESLVTLEGDNAANLWNAIQAGDRVLIQTMRGQVTLVGDGTRTVRTDQN